MIIYSLEELDRTHNERILGPSKQNAEMLDNMVEDGYARKSKDIGTQTQISSGDNVGQSVGCSHESVKSDLWRAWRLRLAIRHCSPGPRCSLTLFSSASSFNTYICLFWTRNCGLDFV